MGTSDETAARLFSKLEELSDDLCVDLGFCGSPGKILTAELMMSLPLRATDFADLAIAGEGSSKDRKLYGPANAGWLLKHKNVAPVEFRDLLVRIFEARFGAELDPGDDTIKALLRFAKNADLLRKNDHRCSLRVDAERRMFAEIEAERLRRSIPVRTAGNADD